MPESVFARISKRISVDGKSGCHIWQGMKNPDGYGLIKVGKRRLCVHRIVYETLVRPIPAGMCVLHDCPEGDNPSCVNPEHLWVGTKAQNNTDRAKKRRCALGTRNGAYTQPHKVARGKTHWSTRYPERYQRGDNHHARRHPEKLARGKRNGAYTHPESVRRGENHGSAKLTEAKVIYIRTRYAAGGVSYQDLALECGVKGPLIYKIVKRRVWKHI